MMPRVEPKKLKGDKRYFDAPRYKAIYGYEDSYKNAFKNNVSLMVKEMVFTLGKFAKGKK